jgi:glycosyltransferase involved in cell wall biosynthesis
MNNKAELKILMITMLFPNIEEPNKAPFILQIAQELSKYAQIKIIAPVRKLPMNSLFKKIIKGYSDIEKIPFSEKFKGLDVYHPNIFLPPKVFRFLHGFLYFLSINNLVKRLSKEFDFDLILSPYLYPDGFASVLIAKSIKKPIVLEARGCDVNLLTKYVIRRGLIKYACKNANAVITVTGDLKNKLMGIGIPEKKISVIYNGVNLESFKPTDKNAARQSLGLPQDKKIVLFAGNLEEVKGIRFLIESWRRLVKKFDKKIILVIIGEGKEKRGLLRLAGKYRLKDYVLIAGSKPHSVMPQWINAADVFCLPSIREGCPNVLLEAISCNKLVVASNVGGIPEIIKPSRSSILVEPGNIESLTEGLEKALSNGPGDISQTASVIPLKPWSDSASQRIRIFKDICEN